MTELTAPMIVKNNDKRIVYGPVLVPNEPDHDGDRVTAEKIEEVAHKFNEQYGNIDLQHTLNNVGRVVESYIAPVDLQFEHATVPKGSWMMGVRVTDNDAWQAVKSGKLTGFSIMGIRAATTKSKEITDAAALKRTTLSDLGPNWVVNAVSLVDEPAVPKAKFLVIKSRDDGETIETEGGFFAKLKQFFKHEIEEEERSNSMNKDELTVMIKSVVSEVLAAQQTGDGPDETAPVQKSADDGPDGVEPTQDTVTVEKSEYDQLQSQVEKQAKQLEQVMNQAEQVIEKAKSYGLFFNSQKAKGQDGDEVVKSTEQQSGRDEFGRRLKEGL